MLEMRQMIQQRHGEHAPLSPVGDRSATPVERGTDIAGIDALRDMVSDADRELTGALSSHESLQLELKRVVTEFKEVRGKCLCDCR
jgi:hypothetical protein